MSAFERKALAAPVLLFCVFFYGCGTPGAPQPPSLNLADPVADLSATRAGSQVTLTWTNPKRNTDRTPLKTDVSARVCRREGAGLCVRVASERAVAPGKADSFIDTLPDPLASGMPRPLSYFVELVNRKGRSAGLSNAATVLAGEAPKPIEGFKAEVHKSGVVLSWIADEENVDVRLHRKLLTPPAKKAQQGLLAPTPEPVEENLLVEAGARETHAIDKSVRFGESYEYRAQRVARVDVLGTTVELAGEFSPPIDVEVKDVFPPAAPTGLATVSTPGENGAPPAIDLSWQPDTETDLAGYIVYRRKDDGDWERISPTAPVIEPAFHDPQVQLGHSYRYAVSAVDRSGHESGRSEEAQETVPEP